VPRNPFGNELFLPVFLWVMLLIVVGLAAVLVAQRRSLRVWRRSTLFQRARTWFVIGPLFVLAVFTGGFVAFLLATFVLLQGLSEFARMAGIQRPYAYLLLLWGQVGLLVAALARDFFGFLPFGFFILLTLVPILSGRVEDAHRQVADTLVGYVFVGLPVAYIVFVNSAETWGLNFLVIVTVSVAVADIAGYAVGAGLRGPKLVPRVDPSKTWGGVLGSLAGATAGVALLWPVVPEEWSVAAVVVLVLVLAVGSVWGDLTESVIRTAFRTEARSTLLLGYGGVLGRVASLLMAFPLCYYALILVGKLVG
jgi:phosphatidate cytidylyltransferase